MAALEKLLQWDRKYYRFTIGSNGHMQPGSGWFIELAGGGRKIILCEEDLDKEDENGRNITCTMDELIEEALKQWHEDSDPKNYRVFYESEHAPKGIETIHHYKNTAMAKVVACNEEEAKQKLTESLKLTESFDSLPFKIIQVWEVNTNWLH